MKEIQPLGFENFPRRYYPDRVRGYFSAPHLRSTPVSVMQLKHRVREFANKRLTLGSYTYVFYFS